MSTETMHRAAAGMAAQFVSAFARSAGRPRILVIAPHNSYRTGSFLEAARKLDIDVLVASEGHYTLASTDAAGLRIDLHDTQSAVRTVLNESLRHPFTGIIGTDDPTTELAALVAEQLSLPHNPPSAVRLARRKDLARRHLLEQGLPVPRHQVIDLHASLASQAELLRFPCVVKPLELSASRGVIRANDFDQFTRACARLERLLASEDVNERDCVLAEDFVPGREVAIEGMLTDGALEALAIFDKPDPLDGPFFEETYYTTPSRLTAATQGVILQTVQRACAAYGLQEGPIHAECRINDKGVWLLEIAARTIGGLCGRLLRFGTGYMLEELVISHAVGAPIAPIPRNEAAGVLMIPVPGAGILRRVEGVFAAQRVPYIEEVAIQIREGYELVPWPEGSSYPGFIFARAPTPGQAEAALRKAHRHLNFVIAPLWKGTTACSPARVS
ncbi:MAG: ATP-grasp domain-containing protein [Acidiferrobacterales bacterium]